MEAYVEKLLITGVETSFGANLTLALQDRWQIAALGGADTSVDLPTVTCDLVDSEALCRRLADESPAWVIHCGQWSRSSWDANAAATDVAHAVQTTQALADACRRQRVRLCVLTSDAQFVGPRIFHAEECPATAVGPQADLARAVEQAAAGPGALIVRTHAYGWSPTDDESSFAQRVWHALNDGRDCAVDDDRYATPILYADLADHLHEALSQRWHGAHHISGIERTNQRRFAAELAVAFGFTGRIVSLVAPENPVGRRLVDETSLNTGAARRKLAQPLPMLREGLLRLALQADGDYRHRLDTLVNGTLVQHRAA